MQKNHAKISFRNIKLIPILIFCLINKSFLFSQNLVPNPSFEDTVSCPFNYNQINRTVGWETFKETPDYFNSCNIGLVGVPNNDPGFQYARTGNAYSGIIPYARFGVNGREIVGIELNQIMAVGQKYNVSFYVSMALGTGQSHYGIAANKLGARFSTIPYSYSNPAPINNFAHIYTDSVISDTSNWILISGTFIADSMYQYLGIGNYFQDSLTSIVIVDSLAAFSYYYIDDITVSLDSESVTVENNFDRTNLISIYPNPSVEYVMVKGIGLKSYSLINTIGYICLNEIFKNKIYNKIDLTHLVKGIYYLKIDSDTNSTIHKIIITE